MEVLVGFSVIVKHQTSRRVVSISNPNCSMFPQQLGHLSNVFMLISTSQSEFVVWRIPRFSLQFDVEMSVAIWRNIIKLINVVKDNLEKWEKLNLSGAQFRLDWWIKSEDSWLMPHNLCQAGRGGGPGAGLLETEQNISSFELFWKAFLWLFPGSMAPHAALNTAN